MQKTFGHLAERTAEKVRVQALQLRVVLRLAERHRGVLRVRGLYPRQELLGGFLRRVRCGLDARHKERGDDA